MRKYLEDNPIVRVARSLRGQLRYGVLLKQKNGLRIIGKDKLIGYTPEVLYYTGAAVRTRDDMG